SSHLPHAGARHRHGSFAMNKPISPKDVAPGKVTTGPLPASRKVHSSPQGHAGIVVPFRDIALSNDASFRVYDTSGPYTDAAVAIDVRQGLVAIRKPWIEARAERPGGLVTQLEFARAGI